MTALPPDHAWAATPGFKIVVVDRGEARFEVPQEWVIAPASDSDLAMTDRPPPDDDCRLEFSRLPLRLPVGEGPSLLDLLAGATGGHTDLDVLASRGPFVERHDSAEVAWSELRYLDRPSSAQALSRMCLVRDRGLHAVFTSTLWAKDAERFSDSWDVLRRSVRLGERYDVSGRDPRRN